MLITRWYAQAEQASSWSARFPRLANLDFDPYSAQGRLAQTLSCVAFVAVPFVAMIHFLLKLYAGTAYQVDNMRFASGLEHLTKWISPTQSFSGRFYYDRDSTVLRGPDFAPFWEPWLFTVWTIFVLGYAIFCLRAVFRKRVDLF